MFKYLISFVLLVGCGGPQTPIEVKVDNILNDFMKDCRSVHGDKCNTLMVVHSLTKLKEEQACWTENGNPARQVALHEDSVIQGNKVVVYELLFECSLNLGTLESKLSKFDEFALDLGLIR